MVRCAELLGALCRQWLNHVVEERGDEWRVTRTTGFHAISKCLVG
jgi:hypothetical protein